MKLSRKSLWFFFALFLVLAAAVVFVQARVLDRVVIDKVLDRVSVQIRSGWHALDARRANLEVVAEFLAEDAAALDADELSSRLAEAKTRHGLDVLVAIDDRGFVVARATGLAAEGRLPLPGLDAAWQEQRPLAGFATVPLDVPLADGVDRSRFCGPSAPSDALILFATKTIPGDGPRRAIVAAVVLDCAEALVDEIAHDLFEDAIYEGRRVGTVTIFRGDARVATTVLDEGGRRAIGTRVSDEVREQTLVRGEAWTGRAFVVNDWYLSRYEPIVDPAGTIIGMLYIGELERLHLDERRGALVVLTLVVLAVVTAAFGASYLGARPAIRQIAALDDATTRFASGDFAVRSGLHSRDEIGDLARSFNTMADEIQADRQRIIEQKEQIEALNRDYIDMLGFVTHEFRGTLGAALFNVQLLEESEPEDLSEDSREMIRVVADALRNLDEITREYLELARIESGALVVNREEVRLVGDVVEPVLRDLQPHLRARRMQVDVSVPPATTVPADPTLLRVVFHNVLGNAAKYGAEGGRIAIECEEREGRAVISIWNDGQSIPSDRLPTLFRKFSRHDVDEATGRRGSGLGLFIVKQIVLGHGGEVWVESEEGKGTRFLFSIAT